MKESSSVLRDLAISLGLLSLVFAGLFVWAFLSSRESDRLTSFFRPQALVQDESPLPISIPATVKTEQREENPEEEISRYVVQNHTVINGESFSLVTGKYWDDIFLWPDLYIQNEEHMKSKDPDLIYPDEIIDIYNRLGVGRNYTVGEKQLILDAYIQVYDRFKALGSKKDGSAWTLLWCGTKYDRNFLNLYRDRIDPLDLAMAQKYVEEEGYLD